MRVWVPGLAAMAAVMATSAPAAAAPAPQPKLVVAISVDQFSASLFEEWRGRFTNGLARLSSGVVYPSGYQSHAATETCPGHASLLTGKYPSKTGIVGNTVRDPETGRNVYCLLDSTVKLAHDDKAQAVGPQRLMATALGDWLKQVSPRSRVVAVSGKDRGAIPMAGQNPDGVFWLFEGYGFTTYIRPGQSPAEALKPVAALNAAEARVWKRKASWTYTSPECRALEATWRFGDKAWPSHLPPENYGASDKPADINRDVMGSPAPDDLTLKGARHLIRYFNLGRGPATDLLAVSFSATDFVGHRYGSKGPEMCEQMHRLDQSIGVLLADLDRLRVPYVVVLSADHGGSDFTERLQAQGYPQARRIDGRAVLARVNQALQAQLGLPAPPLAGTVEDVVVAGPPERKQEIVRAALETFSAQPEVEAAFSSEELLREEPTRGVFPDALSLRGRFARSVYTGRNGDIVAALKPATVANAAVPGGYIAGHGSPWDYDRRVPILFWWKDAPRQDRVLPIETVDIAPTLAALLGAPAPADIDGRCLPLSETGPGQCR